MKTFEVVKVNHNKLVSHTCDLCGQAILPRSMGQFSDSTVLGTTGWSYPEGGEYTRTEVDLCGPCFREKLLPWLISQGVKPTVTTEDF